MELAQSRPWSSHPLVCSPVHHPLRAAVNCAVRDLLSLLVAVVGFGIDISTIYHAALQPASGQDLFYALMFWSLVSYPVLVVIHLIYIRIWHFFSQRRMNSYLVRYRISTVLPGTLSEDVTKPFTAVAAFRGEAKNVLHARWGIVFWVCFALGYASLVMS